MNITVFQERENLTKKVPFKGHTVKDLLHQLKINAEAVIVVKNNEVITEDHPLKDQDKLELLSVISGG